MRTGVARVPSTLTEPSSYVAIPIGLARAGEPALLGADQLYVLDQELPIRLTRLWLNGNGSDVLVRSGFSRPRAVGLGRAGGFFCVADSGTKKMWFGSVTSGGLLGAALRRTRSMRTRRSSRAASRSDRTRAC